GTRRPSRPCGATAGGRRLVPARHVHPNSSRHCCRGSSGSCPGPRPGSTGVPEGGSVVSGASDPDSVGRCPCCCWSIAADGPGGCSPPRCSTSETVAMSWSSSSRSEEHTSELQSRFDIVCRLLLEEKKTHASMRTDKKLCYSSD